MHADEPSHSAFFVYASLLSRSPSVSSLTNTQTLYAPFTRYRQRDIQIRHLTIPHLHPKPPRLTYSLGSSSRGYRRVQLRFLTGQCVSVEQRALHRRVRGFDGEYGSNREIDVCYFYLFCYELVTDGNLL
jgi:hypothetical protein